MSIYNIGRVCVKIAGRDAGKKCVVLSNVEGNLVLVDGETRRKNVNIKHLEPTEKVIEISENAEHSEVDKILSELGFNVWNRKSKPTTERPKQVRKVKDKTEKKPVKKVAKKKEDKISKKEEPKSEVKENIKEATKNEPAQNKNSDPTGLEKKE
ncbi:50S ribosomal protein L14e [archaeon]|jgi:large subunit ribosomal protein L14e|nr:50S ribosomal protein L14e [archaeon]MBT3450320.1 50S ribosomal protein L14e [archaeon]MBT6869190.1 50S ribosomal protein L14e [archaeon]MBT7193726.1 50S ribosomal protein L14e [archaeon]MBT7381373.1 50S ribosomal protein L14e [archaeon]